MCQGGPLDGQQAISRFPKGFLLVDKEGNVCWLYDWDGDGFKVRQEEPSEVLLDGPRNRYRAAREFSYDVLALPGGGEEDGDAGA